MHLLMKASLSGPAYNFHRGAEVPFDDAFPFTANEVRRFIDPEGADIAEYVGAAEDLDAWFDAAGVERVPSLFGSSLLPAIVEIGEYQVQLGGIVRVAFGDFVDGHDGHLSDVAAANAWNDLSDTVREGLLATVLGRLSAEPALVEELIEDASIVERPAAREIEEPAPTTPATEAAAEPAKAEPAPKTKAGAKAAKKD